MVRTFYTYSFGCRVNEAEKEEIDRQMIKSGFKFETEKPDIYIINTCSVTQKAEREARQFIYRVKKQLPNSKIVITGCATTFWLKNKLYQDLPADLLVDNINKEFLVKLISHKFPHRSGEADGHPTVQNHSVLNKFIGSGRMMIKIQDGCQRFCSYCIVPYLRGTPKSSETKEIINKINSLSSKNSSPTVPRNDTISEVILTAINTEAFGLDTKESLVGLLKNVINKTNVPRISLGSIHPWSVDDKFIKFYHDYFSKKRLVDFFHIPLQSASNKTLKLMKRDYKIEEIIDKMNQIKSINPFAFIATDIIVGFLEESDEDFKQGLEILIKSPISRFHIFRYSVRKNTAAYFLSKKLKLPSESQKKERAVILARLSEEKYDSFLKENVGRTSSVLMLKQKIDGYHQGLLDNQLPIRIAARPSASPLRCGSGLPSVKITEFKNGKLFGKLM